MTPYDFPVATMLLSGETADTSSGRSLPDAAQTKSWRLAERAISPDRYAPPSSSEGAQCGDHAPRRNEAAPNTELAAMLIYKESGYPINAARF